MSSFRIIEDDPSFPVKPDDIDCSQPFHWAFPDGVDGPAAHRIAKAVVRLCQAAGRWTSFTREELFAHVTGSDPKGPDPKEPELGGLCDPKYVWRPGEKVSMLDGWIVLGEDGRYRVTSDFIFRILGRAGKPVARPEPSY